MHCLYLLCVIQIHIDNHKLNVHQVKRIESFSMCIVFSRYINVKSAMPIIKDIRSSIQNMNFKKKVIRNTTAEHDLFILWCTQDAILGIALTLD